MCDISGYGADGPYRDRKAYDLMVQAEAGLLAATGSGDAMARAGFSAADVSASMYAFSSVLSALLLRARTGQGSHIDVAMFESLAEWMGNPMYYTFDGQPPPARTGGAHPSTAPYGPTRLGDGQTLMLGVQNEREWRSFCADVLKDAALAEDPRFVTNTLRSQNRDALDVLIATAFAPLDTAEVEARLTRANIAQSRVNTAADLWQHPQLRARERWTEVQTPTGPVPAPGQHTDALLAELGFGPDEIAALHAEAAV